MENIEIIFTVGIPGCGKSTWAKTMQKQNFLIIERDIIREEIFGKSVCTPSEENMVTDICNQIAEIAITGNRNLIFSNTNCNLFFLKKEIAKFKSEKFRVQLKFFDISIEQAIERNIKRAEGGGRRVPDEIIKKMFDNYQIIKHEFENGNLI